jgi:DNA-binding MarR family transcriptional regulator
MEQIASQTPSGDSRTTPVYCLGGDNGPVSLSTDSCLLVLWRGHGAAQRCGGDGVGPPDAEAGQPPAAPSASIVLLTGKVARLAGELLAEALAPLGLRVRHYGVLQALAESGPSSQQALGRSLGIDRTTMVGTVDDLERLGLVARKPDPADRRAYRVELTPRGRTTLVRATGAVAATERALLAPLGAEEQVTLRALLRRLTAPPAAEAEASAGAGPEPGATGGEPS